VLKRLSDAKRDGNSIWAVIRGSAVNQDGQTSSLTAPNGPSQEKVIARALGQAGLEGESIQVVEAHGTGTPLGDPIEVGAMDTVFRGERREGGRYLVGTVKANMGHLESAAGITSLIKGVMCLAKEEIPGQLHLREVNPHIMMEQGKAVMGGGEVIWPRNEIPRRVGVSAFGFSGTNAHVILEEAPAEEADEETETARAEQTVNVLCLSGKTDGALRAQAGRYRAYIEDEGKDERIEDICYTANVGRTQFQERASVVFREREELIEQLNQLAEGTTGGEGIYVGRAQEEPKVGYVFSGEESFVTPRFYRRDVRPLHCTQKPNPDVCPGMLLPYILSITPQARYLHHIPAPTDFHLAYGRHQLT